jgi:hypothetical protein
MEMLWFTLAAIVLYAGSDWLLNRIEIWRGERLENRSLVFFVIILALALALFSLIQQWQPSMQTDVPAPVSRNGQDSVPAQQ